MREGCYWSKNRRHLVGSLHGLPSSLLYMEEFFYAFVGFQFPGYWQIDDPFQTQTNIKILKIEEILKQDSCTGDFFETTLYELPENVIVARVFVNCCLD
jgi:hypothetical protein